MISDMIPGIALSRESNDTHGDDLDTEIDTDTDSIIQNKE